MADDATHKDNDHSGTDADHTHGEPGQTRRPFDTSGMNWVPERDDDDPPYRDWWAVNQEQDDE
ncbi:MAG: hypothetical protein K8F62_14120 [Pseudorhodoplanes sp.]|nr:hypothetical protein [Pseudorhodoplanes sp.]